MLKPFWEANFDLNAADNHTRELSALVKGKACPPRLKFAFSVYATNCRIYLETNEKLLRLYVRY